MGTAPAYTPAWPEKAFGASRRVRSTSAVEGGGGRRRRSSLALQPSTHRHSYEAHAFNNPVIRSYLMEETYQDYRGPCFKVLVVLGLLLSIFGMLAGWTYRKMMCDNLASKLTPAAEKHYACLSSPNDSCTEQSSVYFWNITNAAQVLEGVAPVLEQVGPFVFRETTARWNIRYTTEQPARVDWDQLVFTELLPEQSCAACQLNATFFSANAPYAALMSKFNWNEGPLLLAIVPTALESLLNALQQVLASIASQPSLVSIFPGVAGPLATVALKQWASCGALGMPVLALDNDAISSMLPHTPEFCAWAQAFMGASRNDSSLPLDVAHNFLATLRAKPSFAEQMTHFPPETLAVAMGVTPTQARLLLGYVNYLAFTYAKDAFSQMQGPRLGGASSGPLINRTAMQWLYGWRDPLVSALSPSGLNSSSPWWSYDTNLQLAMRPLSDAARWGQLAAAVGNGTAPAGAASRFHHYTMATGTDAISAAGTLLLDNGVAAVPHSGGDVAVRGKFAGKWGFGDLALLPFGLPLGTMQPQWYFGRMDLSPDPAKGVGLGRAVPMSWDGSAPAMRMHIPTAIFTLAPETLTPCGGAAANSSLEASVAAHGACVTGDYVSGVWNLSSRVGGAPLFMSRAHFYGADPAMAASLGSGAAAMKPDESTHNLRMVLETVVGIPLRVTGGLQSNLGLRPTTIFFPRLWHGAPGPGGFTFFPQRWTAIKYSSSIELTMNIWRVHITTVADPRWLTGVLNVTGAVVAAFATYSLVSAKRNEERLRGQESSRNNSVAAGSLQLFDDEERASSLQMALDSFGQKSSTKDKA